MDRTFMKRRLRQLVRKELERTDLKALVYEALASMDLKGLIRECRAEVFYRNLTSKADPDERSATRILH